jgi:hypothetical protein
VDQQDKTNVATQQQQDPQKIQEEQRLEVLEEERWADDGGPAYDVP